MWNLDGGDWIFGAVMSFIIGVIVLGVLEEFEVTDVFADVPSIEQPECIGDQIIVGRDE